MKTAAPLLAFLLATSALSSCDPSGGEIVVDTSGSRPYDEHERPNPWPLPPPVKKPPVCKAGGDVTLACNPGTYEVQLDASGSFDPDGGKLEFAWDVAFPHAAFNDPTLAAPVLWIHTPDCGFPIHVRLTVTDNEGQSERCGLVVFVSAGSQTATSGNVRPR